MTHPIEILEQYWGYTQFKPLQEEIINSVLQNDDTFALLPTGGGKSVCFQIPALINEGICIVISPLIALMKNQVSDLHKKGIKALALTSEYRYDEIDTMLDNCIYGNYKFLYLSPERLQQEIVQQRIQQMNVNLIAVDEAHCISQWGNDFRPAYKNIVSLRDLLPAVNTIALTASATPKVVEDIINELDLINPKIFRTSFFRENLIYQSLTEEDKLYRLTQILSVHKNSSIIYVRNRKSAYTTAQQLEQRGVQCTFYHGGLSNEEKQANFDKWLNDSKQVMVATNAFGMGIDKADVETVIHINLPESLESYFQEAGRAGRNGQQAYSVLLKNKGDEAMVKNQFLSILPSVDFLKEVYRKLCNYFQIAYGEGAYTSYEFDFKTFCKTYGFNSVLAYNTLNVLDRSSIISLTKQFRKLARLQIIVHNKVLMSYLETHKNVDPTVKIILRTYGGIFDQETSIDLGLIADKLGSSKRLVTEILEQLKRDGIIDLYLSTTDAQISFIEPREDDKTINRIAAFVRQQNNLKKKQVEAVLDYVNNNHICKNIQLLSYFGERNIEPCGKCDVCNKTKKENTRKIKGNVEDLIVEILRNEDLSSREIINKTNLGEQIVLQTLKELMEYNKIEITNINTYTLK